MIGARLPTRRASMDSGVPALILALPGVTCEVHAIGEQRQRRGVDRLPCRTARRRTGRGRAPGGSGGLEAGASQRLARDDGVDVDRRRSPGGVGDHQVRERRRVRRLRDVDCGHQAIVERRGTLLDVTGHLAVGRHPPQRREAPGERSGGDAAPRRRRAPSARPARRRSTATQSRRRRPRPPRAARRAPAPAAPRGSASAPARGRAGLGSVLSSQF